MKYHNLAIKGTGSYLPPNIVSNKELAFTSADWVQEKLGIEFRHIVDQQTPADLGYEAAVHALRASRLRLQDIDMIVVATSSPSQISPSTACTIQAKLGPARTIPAFDLNAACSGFIYALNLCAPLVSFGVVENVLIIAAETYSRHIEAPDRNTVFFGDGAGAVILGSGKGWMACESYADGSGSGSSGFVMPLTGSFQMDGKAVYQNAMKVLPDALRLTLFSEGVTANDITLLIPHQASFPLIKAFAKEVNIPMHRVKTVMHKYGNIAGASIPIALDEATRMNQVGKSGDLLALIAVGAGWTWGTTLIGYEH